MILKWVEHFLRTNPYSDNRSNAYTNKTFADSVRFYDSRLNVMSPHEIENFLETVEKISRLPPSTCEFGNFLWIFIFFFYEAI